jgi:hypothetical protein
MRNSGVAIRSVPFLHFFRKLLSHARPVVTTQEI